MGELIELDSVRSVDEIVKRDIGTSKFILGAINVDGDVVTYISDDIVFQDYVLIKHVINSRSREYDGEEI